jgi:hypothetical protein
MDLDPAAVEAAERALCNRFRAHPLTDEEWGMICRELGVGKTVQAEPARIAVEAAFPIIAAQVALATADAIADKIEAEHLTDNTGEPSDEAYDGALDLAVNIARSHGSQAETTEDGQ